jgi:hypothetical protein
MARVNIPVQELDDRNKFATAAAYTALTTAADATEGAEITWNERDDKYLVFIHNAGSAAATVTIKAGNGIQGVNDLSMSLAAGQYTFVSLDSGRFKNVSGDDKGKVIITGAVKLAVFKLP